MDAGIHLLLVDDHELFRHGLIRLLNSEADFEVVGDCADLDAALEILKRKSVDVVLLDFDLGSEDGCHLLEELGRRVRPRVLMVTGGVSSARMLSALEQGAFGIFMKQAHPAQLPQAIRRVMRGEFWLDPTILKTVVEAAVRPSESPGASDLSARERAVLRGVIAGSTNKQIGAKLALTESSVKTVLQHIFRKTGARTRSQLVRIAIEQHSHDWLSDAD
jgi:two-component system, NarL family, nitrate/nitrite response regulator NarL